MPAPVGACTGGPALVVEQVPVPFQMLRVYALPVALKSAGLALLSCGTAKAKNALGEPTKLGVSSVAVAGSGKMTSTSSTLSLKTICGRFVPASSQVETLLTSYLMIFAPAGCAPAAATYAALVLEVPVGCR